MIFVAWSASAISAARRSELTRSDLPSGPNATGRDERDDLALDQRREQLLVDPVDLAGQLLVHALDDADRHGADRVRDHGLERALPVSPSRMRWETREEARIARSRVAASVTPGAVGVGDRRRRAASASSWSWWPMPCTSTTLIAEAAQDGDVDQQVAEILVGHDRAVDRDDEDLPLEPGHVLQDPAQVRGLDRGRLRGRGRRRRVAG